MNHIPEGLVTDYQASLERTQVVSNPIQTIQDKKFKKRKRTAKDNAT